jgi:protein involved in polysaccharide export with SLBB domain
LVHVATIRRLGAVLRALLVMALGVWLSSACGSRRDNSKVNLAPASEKSTVGPGDIFVMEIVGERDLPREYQVASDGTVDLPYLPALKVQGLEPQEIARLVRSRMIEKGILSDPSVIVQVKEYNSRRITLLGQVSKPGTFPYTPGMSLIQAISIAGGLTPIADSDRVNLTRNTVKGTQTVVLSLDQMMEGREPDIQLQPGDRIFVHDRLF